MTSTVWVIDMFISMIHVHHSDSMPNSEYFIYHFITTGIIQLWFNQILLSLIGVMAVQAVIFSATRIIMI